MIGGKSTIEYNYLFSFLKFLLRNFQEYMCGRFELTTNFEKLPKILKKDYPIGLDIKYEKQNLIRPSDPILVLKNEGIIKTTFMSWGFITPGLKTHLIKKDQDHLMQDQNL